MMQTKKVVGFVVELYKMTSYWHSENGYAYEYNYNTNKYQKVKATRFNLTPDCYKRTYYRRFNSVRKMNKELGLKKGKYYYFYTSLEDAIKGAFGDGYHAIANRSDEILVIRQLHDLDNRYIYVSK